MNFKLNSCFVLKKCIKDLQFDNGDLSSMRAYNFVSESKTLQELFDPLSIGIGSGVLAAWMINRILRTKKILSKYPTPEDMYQKLMRTNNMYVKDVAQELRGMDQKTYIKWVKMKFNPKATMGKMLLTAVFPVIAAVGQTAVTAVDNTKGADGLVDKAITSKNIYNK